MTKTEMDSLGWEQCDIILVSGDAYVDHPSFGPAIIGRVLEAQGFKVGIIAQPDWHSPDDFTRLGRPRLFFGVTSGNIDSMLHHYTANKKLRHDDPYSPGGRHGLRPNRAAIVYSNLIRQAYKDVPIVLGGIEASLRRLAHYDYWDDAARRSILFDARADLLVYGMGEKAIGRIAQILNTEGGIQKPVLRLANLPDIRMDLELQDIPGTAVIIRGSELQNIGTSDTVELPSFEEVSASKEAFNRAFVIAANEANPYFGKRLLQKHGDRYLLVNPPALPMNSEELDAVYALPFQRQPHPSYTEPIPALETVKWSVTSHRGCYGGCSFCTLFFHQGPVIQSRSIESIINEIELLARDPKFKGIISDIGGPTANMYGTGCKIDGRERFCRKPSCLAPQMCENLKPGQHASVKLWHEALKVPGVKNIFVASGVRYDLALHDHKYSKELIQKHTGGHLKVAPEHCAANVLKQMNKPALSVFIEFIKIFRHLSKKEQYLVPYLISSHPGCSYDDMLDLKSFLKRNDLVVEQVQDFIPLPMTASAAMYHTGRNPYSGQELFVEKTAAGKLRQRYVLEAGRGDQWEGSGKNERKYKRLKQTRRKP
ncbi:MAG: YgiQ family radical SAM protein [Candidatus Edwardsbacteria bacterium]|nr:YgiQ family radical SAM protein [Candidatus Edwardsbacteria bacterium]MBU1576954.1 YgiQ family radical SAM protein [Candidatus Edwardsbacteria bacterium]MBU2463290.1 YgiQ family radical SAM protein [Candidatus Edwardsbacteria bacterium]MBU2594613.1 YgiQ family radical SAM protein [Candidatus Edwardsbacteria bacterium]